MGKSIRTNTNAKYAHTTPHQHGAGLHVWTAQCTKQHLDVYILKKVLYPITLFNLVALTRTVW